MMILVDADLQGRNWVIIEVRLILDKGEPLPILAEVEDVLRKAYRRLPKTSTIHMKIVRLDEKKGGKSG